MLDRSDRWIKPFKHCGPRTGLLFNSCWLSINTCLYVHYSLFTIWGHVNIFLKKGKKAGCCISSCFLSVIAQNGQYTSSVPVKSVWNLFYCSSFTWKPAECKMSCVCVCFVRCSFGQFGLWENLRVVQCGGVGQSNRRRAEPGQRRGAKICSQILSGGQTAAQLRGDL